jgi:outer membrane receptor protein involved in Fe transport
MRTAIVLFAAALMAAGDSAPAQPTTAPTTMPAETQPTTSNQNPLTLQTPLLPQPPSQENETAPTSQLGKVVVTSDMDVARAQIAPSLGASTYTQTAAQIQNIPGGSNAPFQQVLLRAPGVVEDSFGQEHVRGEHANLTYRINGVLLPQPISQFSQELDTRLVDSVTLVTGSLPAQYGFHTAGIVDVQTKSGDTLDHNELSLYGGSFDTFNPSAQVGGTSGKLDYFVTVSYLHSGLGIENPLPTYRAIHDYTDQERAFGYFSYRLDETSRVSLLMNATVARFELPNTPGLPQAFDLAGTPAFDSSNLNDTQNEQEYYTVVSYQKTADKLSFQLSGFSRYAQISFKPDSTGDLIFNGVSSGIYNSFITNGVQFDASYILNDHHTVRGGFVADYTGEKFNSNTGVFQVDATGAQSTNVPTYISDESPNHAIEAGLYLQDEWRITPKVTVNYGFRYDRFDANFDNEDQLSPRVNLVWKMDDKTTFHIGYARYFVPPPVQNVTLMTVNKFTGTTNEAGVDLADPPTAERSNYYDIGIERKVTDELTVGVDGFYKSARNLVDLGQFGSALIETPFNYATGKVYGAEMSTQYQHDGFSAFGNLSWVETRARDINSQQFQIDPDEFAFIADTDIKLDHEAEFSGSAGVAYQWKNDRVYADILYSSGLRSGFANTGQVAPHHPVNVGYEHIWRSGPGGHPMRFRVDVVNLFDEKYELRDGSGIGVGAAQFGERLGVFAGITYEF